MSVKKYLRVKIERRDGRLLSFLYGTNPGRLLLRGLISPPVSKVTGAFLDCRCSRLLIDWYIRQAQIDLSDYRKKVYRSFNDFFTREIKPQKRPYSDNPEDLIAPCDGKLTAYRISAGRCFYIKGRHYQLRELLRDEALAAEFADGTALVFRLEPADYHRYGYITDGEILMHRAIGGVLHTARPIAHHHVNVFGENSREYEVMRTATGQQLIQMEVGALLVGKITNHKCSGTFRRGEEKGMFEFGGSTIVIFFRADEIIPDSEIVYNTNQNYETIVRKGQTIGAWKQADQGGRR